MEPSYNSSNENIKGYVDYLDKEMTIMGILSTFCIVSLGFVAEKLIFPDKDSNTAFWENVTFLCFLGLGGFLSAGWCFYRQRSLLAWYFGQISLYKARGDEEKVKSLLTDSDAWSNWTWYQGGFGGLFLAFFSLGCVSLSDVWPFIVHWQFPIGCGCLLLCGLWSGFVIAAYILFPFEDEPGPALRRRLFRQR